MVTKVVLVVYYSLIICESKYVKDTSSKNWVFTVSGNLSCLGTIIKFSLSIPLGILDIKADRFGLIFMFLWR